MKLISSEIENRYSQSLVIQCYSYDSESASLLSSFTKKSSENR